MINLKESNFEDYRLARINTGIYLAACLSEEETKELKEKWKQNGGYKAIPWYEWVLQNVSVNID